MKVIKMLPYYPQYVQYVCNYCGETDIFLAEQNFCYHCGAEVEENLDLLYENIDERVKYHKEGGNLC